jgi:hypothetical protein
MAQEKRGVLIVDKLDVAILVKSRHGEKRYVRLDAHSIYNEKEKGCFMLIISMIYRVSQR